MFIAVDFDGTCVTHEYPKVGRDIGAEQVLKELLSEGHQLILYTMRCNNETDVKGNGKEIFGCKKGNYLNDAIEWFNERNIKLSGININPEQSSWTSSPKVYAHLYIDDAALGIPLIYVCHERPHVDWFKCRELLIKKGFITDNDK